MKKEDVKRQLGITHSGARNRLLRNLLFKYITMAGDHVCYRCGEPIEDPLDMTIEHEVPWHNSDNPVELYFDLNNISFSHHKCNAGAARKPTKKYHTAEEKRQAKVKGQRDWRARQPKEKLRAIRQDKYRRNGT